MLLGWRKSINCLIYENRADGQVFFKDKIRVKKDRKSQSFKGKLKKRRREIELPSKALMSKDNWMILWSPSEDTYIPCKFENGNVIPQEEDYRAWLVWRIKRSNEKWRHMSRLQELLPIMTIPLAGVAIMLILVGFAQLEAAVTGNLLSAADNLRQAAELLGQGAP